MHIEKYLKSPLPLLLKGAKPKRIGIDARFYGPVGKGLGRYTQEIVDNIIRHDQANRYVIFLGRENYNEFKADDDRVKKVLVKIRWYSLAEQLIMPYFIWRERLDLMHFPHFNVPIFCPVKFVVTIHDLILIKFPTERATTLGPLLYKIKNLAYRLVIWSAVKRARRVIAVSEFTKDDLVRQFKLNPDKITVTYEGVASLTFQPPLIPLPASLLIRRGEREERSDKDILLGYNIYKPYLLYVGNAYPHKNLEGLIKVFSRLDCGTTNAAYPNEKRKYNLQLVLVGKEDYFYERLKNFVGQLGLLKEKNSPVVFPDYVRDNDLKILYQQAIAYVFPSFYEGFGLPPLEAMANGCPVVSSNRTSLPEILGDAALYFDPSDENDMFKQILLIISNKNMREQLAKKGSEQAKKYSWQRCARETLEIYLKA